MSKNPQLLNQYTDILKQPTASDAIGDAYSNAASAPANGPAQRETNALLAGIGGGFKASANSQRNSKLQAIEAQTAQLLQADVLLQNQMYEAEDLKYKTSSFFKQNAVPLAELSKASMAGDSMASDQLAQGVLRNYKQIFQDQSVGDFDHYKNGVVYYHNPETETVEGRNIMSLMYQTGTNPADIWGQDAPMIEAGLSAGARQNYMDDRQRKQLELQGKALDNQYTQAQIDQARTKSEVARNEMNAPKSKYSDTVLNKLIETNQKWVNDLDQEQTQLGEQEIAYTKIADLIDKEKGAFGRAGAGLIAQARRAINESGTESDRNQALLELYKQPLMTGIKALFSGATSDKDIAVFVAGLPSLDKNPEAAIQVARERASNLRNRITKNNLTQDVVENVFGWAEPYNSSAVQKIVKERMNQSNDNQEQKSNSADTVRMSSPDGQFFDVPVDRVELFKQNGYK